jgi:hypothetical protein
MIQSHLIIVIVVIIALIVFIAAYFVYLRRLIRSHRTPLNLNAEIPTDELIISHQLI